MHKCWSDHTGYCKCCVKTHKDRLFKKGRDKLHTEIDILHIVKQLRISQFVADLVLTPAQKNLVVWFDKYKLKESEDEDVDVDEI